MYITCVRERPTTGFLLWRLTTRWRAAVDRALAPMGLTHAQYTLLASLYGYTAHQALGEISHELLRTRFPQPRAEIEATMASPAPDECERQRPW